MLFLFVNLAILLSYYFFFTRIKIQPLSAKFVAVGLLYFSQIIFTILCLGVWGKLYSSWVIGLNLAIAAIILTLNLRSFNFTAEFKQDLDDLRQWRAAFHWENILLGTLALIAFLWLVLAAYFLPPRGIDDVLFHLPRIYDYWVKHRIDLMPVDYYAYYAFPENAELFFLWPIIFTNSQRWVDAGQIPFGLFAMVVVFALFRSRHLKPRESLFLSLLFFLTPVVLNQMGTNYIDVATAAIFLTALFCAIRYSQRGETTFLYLTALAMGLGVGMKYTLLPLIAYLQILILPTLWRAKKTYWMLYPVVIMLSGGFWYLRNWLLLHDPLYPSSLIVSELKNSIPAATGTLSIIPLFLQTAAEKFYQLAIRDNLLGSSDGGLGVLFWAVAFPCWLLAFPEALRQFKKRQFLVLFLWGLIPLGLGLLIFRHVDDYKFAVRNALFIVPISFIFMGETMRAWDPSPLTKKFVRAGGVVLAFLSLSVLAGSLRPSFRFDLALQDWRKGTWTTEYKYIGQYNWTIPSALRSVAEPLEYLTAEGLPGLSCYVASDSPISWITAYGTRFQNHPWNLSPDRTREPDAYIFIKLMPGDDYVYYRRKITLAEALADKKLTLIVATPHTWVFLRKDFLDQKKWRDRLLKYYQDNFPI